MTLLIVIRRVTRERSDLATIRLLRLETRKWPTMSKPRLHAELRFLPGHTKYAILSWFIRDVYDWVLACHLSYRKFST